jgi:large subunit ribosomal protein L3
VNLGLLGHKIGMTQVFDKKGHIVPVTLIKGGPCYVTQIKSKEKCGYNAIQLGYMELTTKKCTKPMSGHFLAQNSSSFKFLKEYKVQTITSPVGTEFNVSMFKIGSKITISSFTIGKGNTGNIKKNNFSRGPMAHGSKHHRLQGSLGAGTTPGRVFPGKKMPGRSGLERRTITGLEVINIDLIKNLILIKGSIPGKTGNLVNLSFPSFKDHKELV